MKEKYNYIQKQINLGKYLLNNYFITDLEFTAYCMFSFFVPFLIAGPQIVVGSIVNTVLILSALRLQLNKTIPMIILPSIAAFFAGVIFAGLDLTTIYFAPIIWIANAILVYIIARRNTNTIKNIVMHTTKGIIAKVAVLSLASFACVSLGFFPAAFFAIMSISQLQSAVIGAIMALTLHRALGECNISRM